MNWKLGGVLNVSFRTYLLRKDTCVLNFYMFSISSRSQFPHGLYFLMFLILSWSILLHVLD